jgi:ABC-type transporter Mla subunit MlaD
MSDLQETLKMLGDNVPKITDEMNQLVQAGEQAEKNSEELLKVYEQCEQDAREIFQQIEHALADLKKDAAEHLTALQQELGEVEKGLDEVKTLEQTRDELKQGVETAEHAMDSFQKKLHEGSEAIDHAHEAFNNGLNELKHGVEEGFNLLHGAHEALHSAGEALQHKVEEHKNTITDLIENTFGNAMNQHLQDAEHKVTDFLQQAQTLGDTFQHGAEDILNNVVKAKSHEIMDLAKQKIEDELKQLMDKATDEICHAIEEMANKVTGAKDTSSEKRDMMKPLFEQLDNFKKPFEDAINAVKGACETVGISFG